MLARPSLSTSTSRPLTTINNGRSMNQLNMKNNLNMNHIQNLHQSSSFFSHPTSTSTLTKTTTTTTSSMVKSFSTSSQVNRSYEPPTKEHEWGVTPNLTEEYADEKKLFSHRVPTRISDSVARNIVKLLRIPMDLFFSKRYGSRAVVLETVAAVPGMVGGMWLHLKSLRRFEPDTDHWIHELLDEARNERMHLMSFMDIAKPNYLERVLVLLAQGVFWNAYFALFLISQRTAHRMVGYLEEEAVVSYTRYLKEIDEGRVANVPAPKIAKDYWQLSENADLKELVKAVRADECGHRDRNHEISDILSDRKGIKDRKEYKFGEKYAH